MMTDAQIQRFKPGRKFTSIIDNKTWTIDGINITDSFLYVTDEHHYSSTMSIDDFDRLHYFLDDLPTGWSPDWTILQNPMYPVKCQCGADSYYGINKGPHADYCPKYTKEGNTSK